MFQTHQLSHFRLWLGAPRGEYEGFGSHHPGGAGFLLGDGSVHFLDETIDLWTFGWLGHRNDGQVIAGEY